MTDDIQGHEIVAPADSQEVNYGYWPSKWVTIKEFREMYPRTEYYSREAIIGFLDEYRKLWESKGLTLEQIERAMKNDQ